jgi:plastocyanin
MLRSSLNPKLPRRPLFGARPLFPVISILFILTATFVLSVPNGLETAHGSSQATVTIIDNAFLPKHINVTTGTTVLWNYASNWSSQHTVTSVGNTTQSGAPLLNSGTLNPGQNYRYTFYNPGLYTYQCSYHFTTPAMSNAWVNVTGSPISPPSSHPPIDSWIWVTAGTVGAVIVATLIVLVRRKPRTPSAPPT